MEDISRINEIIRVASHSDTDAYNNSREPDFSRYWGAEDHDGDWKYDYDA